MESSRQQQIVSYLCAHRADIEARGREPWNPLHFCAYYGRVDLLMILLSFGACMDARADCYVSETRNICFGNVQSWYGGETALFCAAARGHMDCLLRLIEARADVSVTDSRGRTWMQVATGSCLLIVSAVQTTTCLLRNSSIDISPSG
eukprot:Skav226815  [mRNA]  locus=scaffold7297:1240:1683:+ [translate_table: standard]